MSTRVLFFIFFLIFFLKITAILFVLSYGHNVFGGGNDANYYDDYALGNGDFAANIWPVILRFLNDVGMYSRNGVIVLMMLFGMIVIPIISARLSVIKGSLFENRVFWFVIVFVSAYPTLFYYTLDIYRDVFMVVIFLLGLMLIKRFIESSSFLNCSLMVPLLLCIMILLYLLRPYLGFSFLGSFLIYRFFSFKKWPFWTTLILFLITINILFSLDLFESILKYRDIFSEDMDGGSNMGISFDNPFTFLLNFVKNFSNQMLGVFFSGISTLIVFLIESVPFIILLIYLVKNRRYSDKFVDFLMVFFVIYSTIWLLGNDNLGTAVRLRIYSYLSVLISCMIVFQRKRNPTVELVNGESL